MKLQQIHTCSDAEFLDYLAEREIELRIQDGKLRISAPVGSVDDTLKSELVRRKAMLLASIGAKKAPTSVNFTSAGLSENLSGNHDRAPLSYAQERLWVLERFHPGNFAYNIPETSEINAAIDRELMQRAIDAVVQRHAVLRTSIQEDEHGNALQQIHPHLSAPLQFLDFRHLDAAVKEKQLQKLIRDLSREPFDLRVAPMVRFCLIQLEAEKHIVFINIHHIVSDQWSMRILYRELLAAYQAYAEGKEPLFPPLSLQYADYARRERALEPSASTVAGSRSIRDQLQYWQEQFAEAPDPPQLPFKLKPAVIKPFDGAISRVELSAEDTTGIRSLARGHGASPYMVLLAAYAVLLHRFTGAGDLCIGAPVSERISTDTEALMGLFVNTLVMRCVVPREITFAQLLRNVRETVLNAHANHEVPFQLLLSHLHPDGGGASQPLFQTMLAFDSYTGAEQSAVVAADPGFAKFELTLQMWESRDRISGWFEYRTDLFTAEAIAKFAQAFLLLIRSAIQDPAKEVAKLKIISAERERQLQLWNATDMDFPRDRGIHQLFEEQVERTPNAVAVIDGTKRMTYRELNRMANRVAHGLIALGTHVESIVGIHMERTAAIIATMLGILKAGGAYLPLDPQYPEERLRTMIEDSSCAFVVSDSPDGSKFSSQTRVLTPSELQKGASDHNPEVAISPSNLSYLLYTSGSTGRPKGVALEHHSAVSLLQWFRNTYPAESLRGTLASTSISFDLSVVEIFLPLISGHAAILAQDVLTFPDLPAAAEVTMVTTVPSAAAALLATGKIPATLRVVNMAGEPLSTSLVERFYAETAITDVYDLYGPTETTTFSTGNRRSPGRPPTIGRPMGNTRLYIVDASLELVPEGVPGELLIAGEGVARGYLRRPDLTAERFISVPHLREKGIAYRSGDLCRFTAEGSVECLGRLDGQVKVRGFRLEVGEVEATLLSHPTVFEAVVIAHADGDAGAALIAAVVLEPSQALDIPALIAHQVRALPAYMVARNIMAVDEFPRTATGKIDRNQLKALLLTHPVAKAVTAPRDPLEGELTNIWQESFPTSTVGIDDDFFQLGGHSLLALRIFAEIEAKLKYRMMLSVLFHAPTIRQLAEHIRQEWPPQAN
jgi:amino acid adenylation domain-containing protein